MSKDRTCLTLVIPPEIKEYGKLVYECSDFIADIREFYNSRMLSKFKVAIIELINNAIKHTDTESTLIINKLTNQIVIEKVDYGKKFSFILSRDGERLSLPFDNHPTGKLEIYLGENYHLPVQFNSPTELEFLSPAAYDYDLDSIPEHFGMMIIRESCDKLCYNYNPTTNCNTFKVIFNL